MDEKLKKDLEKQVEEQISGVMDDGINKDNLESLGDLIDIMKDVKNIDYWKVKEEAIMRGNRGRGMYGNYDEMEEYGRRGRDSRGRYARRGVPGSGRGRYGHGSYPMEELMECYEYYGDAAEEMDRGNYGAANEMIKATESIMKNIYEIVEELSDANVPEVMEIIKRYTKKMSEMI